MLVECDLVHLIVKRVLSTAFFVFVEPVELGLHTLMEKTFLSRSRVDVFGDGFGFSVEALIGPNLLSKMVLGFLGVCPESGYDPSHDEMEDVCLKKLIHFINATIGNNRPNPVKVKLMFGVYGYLPQQISDASESNWTFHPFFEKQYSGKIDFIELVGELAQRKPEIRYYAIYPVVRVRCKDVGGSGTVIFSGQNAEGEYETYVLTNHHVIEKAIEGGQLNLTTTIDNYPGFSNIRGEELAAKMKDHARQLGAEFLNGVVTKIEKHDEYHTIMLQDGKAILANVILLAMGANPKKLNVPGEKEFTARGISYCATCDGYFFKDKHVMVIGGGDTAMNEALHLSRIAKSVTVVHRRDKLRAVKTLQDKVFSDDAISFEWNSIVDRFEGSSVLVYRGLMVTFFGENVGQQED